VWHGELSHFCSEVSVGHYGVQPDGGNRGKRPREQKQVAEIAGIVSEFLELVGLHFLVVRSIGVLIEHTQAVRSRVAVWTVAIKPDAGLGDNDRVAAVADREDDAGVPNVVAQRNIREALAGRQVLEKPFADARSE